MRLFEKQRRLRIEGTLPARAAQREAVARPGLEVLELPSDGRSLRFVAGRGGRGIP